MTQVREPVVQMTVFRCSADKRIFTCPGSVRDGRCMACELP